MATAAIDLTRHRREFILGGVLAALGVAFLYVRTGAGGEGPGGEIATFVTGPPPSVARTLSQLQSVRLPSVMIDRLEEPPIRYDPTQRNIFRFGNIPPPPPTPAELAAIEAAKRAAEEARQAAIQEEQRRQTALLEEQRRQAELPPINPATGLPVGQEPPPPPLPIPPAITLRYSGFLGSDRNRMAVLQSGEDLILARVGDTVSRDFKVLDIGFDWVKIGYVNPQFEDQYQKLRMGP